LGSRVQISNLHEGIIAMTKVIHTNTRELGSAVDQLGNEAHEAAECLKNVGGAAVRQAEAGFDAVREKAAGYLDQGREKACEVRRTLDERIRSQPVKSLLIAVGIGAALGVFLTRRC